MDPEKLRTEWKNEERIAHIRGWDFSHIEGRYAQGGLPWDYGAIVREHLRDEMMLLDQDTGGGEFLLSLGHPPRNTCATEGYAPNVRLCETTLKPLGIDLRECGDPSRVPFPDSRFDIVINRHGSFDAGEIRRLLKRGGLFITQQVGDDNDRDLTAAVLPDVPRPFPHLNLRTQRKVFEDEGFEILQAAEAFRPIRFFDMRAFVWFARIITWEFPGFTVDRCFDRLVALQRELEAKGCIEGTIHRYLIVARSV